MEYIFSSQYDIHVKISLFSLQLPNHESNQRNLRPCLFKIFFMTFTSQKVEAK